MTNYVAFLRGINVGGANKISMPALRALGEELGYDDVSTYINSGNLLFGSTTSVKSLESELSQAINETFGKSIDVTVRSDAQLRTILQVNPYPEGNPSQVTVAFLTAPAGSNAQEKVAAVASEHEPFTFAGLEVYVNYTHGIGNSKLAEQFSKIIGVSATVRNIRTVGKIVAKLDSN